MANKQISDLDIGQITDNDDAFIIDTFDGTTVQIPYSVLASALLRLSLGAGSGITIEEDETSDVFKVIVSATGSDGTVWYITDTEPVEPSSGSVWLHTDATNYGDIDVYDGTAWVTRANLKGDTGTAATIQLGTVTTGAAGTNASITNSGTSNAAVFNFVIPRGDTGETGATGAQGYSISVSVTTITGGHRVTLHSTDPTASDTYFDVMDGSGGGSSGGGGSYSETVLYNAGSDINSGSIISLAQNYTQYDNIRIEWSYGDSNLFVACESNYNAGYLQQVKDIADSGTYSTVEVYAPGYDNVGFAFVPISSTQLRVTEVLGSYTKYIREIVGVIYGGSSVKSITYTGTGSPSHQIIFPEKPTVLIALKGDSAGGSLEYIPVYYGADRWNYLWANGYTNGSGGSSTLTYSADELTMTMTHSDSNGAGACNLADTVYTLYYV